MAVTHRADCPPIHSKAHSLPLLTSYHQRYFFSGRIRIVSWTTGVWEFIGGISTEGNRGKDLSDSRNEPIPSLSVSHWGSCRTCSLRLAQVKVQEVSHFPLVTAHNAAPTWLAGILFLQHTSTSAGGPQVNSVSRLAQTSSKFRLGQTNTLEFGMLSCFPGQP